MRLSTILFSTMGLIFLIQYLFGGITSSRSALAFERGAKKYRGRTDGKVVNLVTFQKKKVISRKVTLFPGGINTRYSYQGYKFTWPEGEKGEHKEVEIFVQVEANDASLDVLLVFESEDGKKTSFSQRVRNKNLLLRETLEEYIVSIKMYVFAEKADFAFGGYPKVSYSWSFSRL